MSYLDSVKTVLAQMKPDLSERYGVDQLGLFGSIVRDDFTDESDIDIVVTFTIPINTDFFILADELEKKLQRRVDLVSRNGIKPGYFKVIEPEIIYV